IERNGEHSDKGDRNREIEESNRRRDELVAELAAVEAEIVAEEERLLNERFGDPEPDASEAAGDRSEHRTPEEEPEPLPDRPDAAHDVSGPRASPRPEDGAATGWWTRALDYARGAASTLWGLHEEMNAWRRGEIDEHFRKSPP